jgi:hypothetical protein
MTRHTIIARIDRGDESEDGRAVLAVDDADDDDADDDDDDDADADADESDEDDDESDEEEEDDDDPVLEAWIQSWAIPLLALV